MTIWLSAGIIFTFFAVTFVLVRWGNVRCVGSTPVRTLTFIAILFTSGLDMALITLPLTEFANYAEIQTNPEYASTNPLAIEFGFWGFLIWAYYFLTCFYFCIIEPKVKFFELPLVKIINNFVIIGTSAFAASLLLAKLPWYLPDLGHDKTTNLYFYLIVFISISIAAYSSSNLSYIRFLSIFTTLLFFALILIMSIGAMISTENSIVKMIQTFTLLGDYFSNIHQFILPLNDYHEFYLLWWFSWSIMIGQFTSRFVGGLTTWQLCATMLIMPSIIIGIWFTVLYYYHTNGLDTVKYYHLAMVFVGVTFFINSLDSLIRLYTDNLNLTVARFGIVKYLIGNIAVMSILTLLFNLEFLRVQWSGALVIGLFFTCFGYIVLFKLKPVMQIKTQRKKVTVNYDGLKLFD